MKMYNVEDNLTDHHNMHVYKHMGHTFHASHKYVY